MGFKDFKRDLIEKAAVWWIRDWVRRAAAGEKGPEMQRLVTWIMCNRQKIGWVLNFIAGGILAAQVEFPTMGDGWHVAAFILGYCGVALVGAGAYKSDQYHRDRLMGAGKGPGKGPVVP